MVDKIVVIIGGNSGVGKKTAQDLIQKNYRIIIVGQNERKGEEVIHQLKRLSSTSQVSFLQANLSTKVAITKFAERVSKLVDHIDVLISTMGILQTRQVLTEDGYDRNFVINYLAHFWLINALLPLLKKAAQGRILLVGALPIIVRHLKVETPQSVPSAENYSGMAITGQALVGRLLLIQKLSKILQETKVTVNIFHPGNIPDSKYGSTSSGFLFKFMGPLLARLSKKNCTIGSQLATDSTFNQMTGQFFNESGKVISLPHQFSEEMAEQWWSVSQAL